MNAAKLRQGTFKTSRAARVAAALLATTVIALLLVVGPPPAANPAEAVSSTDDLFPLDATDPTTRWPIADPDFHYGSYTDTCGGNDTDGAINKIYNDPVDINPNDGTIPDKANICDVHYGWFLDDEPGADYGDMWICIAIDFLADTGQTGFWLELNQSAQLLPDGQADRSSGDLLLGFETLLNKPYSGIPDVYVWDDNQPSGASQMVPAPNPLVFEASGGKKPPGVNFEICINMTDSGLINPPCGFAGFGAYSQPSYGFDAELKDFLAPQSLDATDCAQIIIDKVGEGDPDSLAVDQFTFDLLDDAGNPVISANPGTPGGPIPFDPFINPSEDLNNNGIVGDDLPLPNDPPAYPPDGDDFILLDGDNPGATFFVRANRDYTIQEVAMEADWKFESVMCDGDFANLPSSDPNYPGTQPVVYTPAPSDPNTTPPTWDLTETSDDGTDAAWGAPSPIATFNPAGGSVVTCTFYNEQAAQIDVAKVSDPVDATLFEFSVSNDFGSFDAIPGVPTDVTCPVPATLTGGSQCSIGLIDADDTGWTISEVSPPSPYINTSAICTDQDGTVRGTSTGDFLAPTPYTVSAIDPAYGDLITCEFVNVVPDPAVGLAKAVSAGPTFNPNGSANLSYTFVVENTGNTTLNPVQVNDDLFATFGAASQFSNIVVDGAGLCDTFENAAYDGGASDSALLIASPTLAIDETCEITVSFDVIPGDLAPGDNFGTIFENSATVSATDVFLRPVSDISTDGSDTDPEDDGAGDNSVPTPVSFAPAPEIGTAKQISGDPVLNADGSITVTYEMLVENSGNVTLSNVSLPDDLETVFGAGSIITVDSLAVAHDPLTSTSPLAPNGSYDGTATNADLLDGTGELIPGESATITLTVTVKPATLPPGPYSNSVVATGDDPLGGSVSDTSDDGASPDGDGNNDPSDDSDPTVFSMPVAAEIGLAKSVSAGPTLNADGTTSITYTLVVENSGDVDLDPLQITDDLLATFGAASLVSNAVVDADDAGLCEGFENGSYDGTAAIDLFNGTAELAKGASCTLTVSFDVIPGDSAPGDNFGSTFDNTATATGTDPFGTGVSDDSVDGTDPDPEDDGPGDNTSPTPVTFGPAPEMTLTKSTASGPTPQTSGNLTGSYTIVVTNSGDVNLDDVQVVDDLTATFGPGTVWVSGSVIANGVCATNENASFDGTTSRDLLDGGTSSGVSLIPDASCTFTVTYEVAPGTPPAIAPAVQTYTNTAVGSSTDPYGNSIGDSDQTSGNVSYSQGLDVSKTIISTAVNPDATLSVEYDLTLFNPGDVDLSDMSLLDDLSATFGIDAASDFTVGPTLTTDPSNCFTTNGAYDGITDTQTLAAGNTLAAGATCTVTIAATLTIAELDPLPPATGDQAYANTANGAGDNPYGTTLTGSDISEIKIVDSDFTLAMGVLKTVTAGFPTLNDDGTYNISYDIFVNNAGTLNIENLSVVDDVSAVYGAGASITSPAVASSAGCDPNPAWDGSGDTELVDPLGDNDLTVAEDSCTFTVTFTVLPDPAPAIAPNTTTYTNTAAASGEAPGIGSITGSDSDTADTKLSFEAEIGVAKTIATGPTLNADGTITLTYDILVENTGNVTVSNIQVPDDLETVFGTGSTITINTLTTDANLTPNTGYDGLTTGDTNLLNGLGDLAPSETSTISLTITVLPTNPLPGPYQNSVTATGTDPYGTTITDDSVDGTNVDPTNDNDPTNDTSPTEFTLPFEAEIGVAKRVSAGPTINADGTTSITYTLVVENSGTVNMDPVQVTDDLFATFGAASVFSNIVVDADDAGVCEGFENAAYDGGSTTTNLFDAAAVPGPKLGAGETCTIDISFDVIPGATAPGDNFGTTYNNTATATGTDPYGTTITDDSVDGTDPDLDGNNDPTDDTSPTPVSFSPAPEMTVTKAIGVAPTPTAGGNLTGTYRVTVSNTGIINLDDVQVIDDFEATFGVGTVWVSGSVVADSVCLSSENLTYAGVGGGTDVELVAGGATSGLALAPNDVCVFTITYEVTPGTPPAIAPAVETYTNTATGSSTDPYGNNIGDSGQTSSDVSISPGLDLTKNVVTSAVNPDGTLNVAYDLVLVNTGGVDLTDLTLTDDMKATFGIDAAADIVTGPALTATPLACLPTSGGYDGVTDVEMLSTPNALAAGATCTITVTATITIGQMVPLPPASGDQVYTNTADTAGSDPYGNTVGDTDSGALTIVDAEFTLAMGVLKTLNAGFPVFNTDGTMDVSYDIEVSNTGTLNIDNLAVTDDVLAVYGASATLSSQTVSATAPCTANTGWTGDPTTDVDLLAGTDTLLAAPGAPTSCTITVSFTVLAATAPAVTPATTTYTNTANADGNAPGIPSMTVAESGTDAYDISYNPELGVAKNISVDPVLNPDGTITLTYSILIENTGDITVSGIQVPENLESVFGAGSAVTIDSLSASAPLTENGGFTGLVAGDIDLLDGLGSLAPGEFSTITLGITVKPTTALPGPFDNNVTATGTDPWGNPVADESTDGIDPDPNNDNSTGDNSVPTSFVMPFNAEIGVAKQVTAGPTVNADGSFNLTYTFVVENFGDVNLNPVSIDDNLYTTFGAASLFANVVVDADDAGVCEGFENSSFDGGDTAGANDTDLFNGTGELAVGESCTVEVSFDVTPGATVPGDNFGTTYNNTAVASGTDPYGNGVNDDSVDGADPDPEDDGPGDNTSPTPVSFGPNPQMTVTKAAPTPPTVTADGDLEGVFTVTVSNPGDVNLYDVQLVDNFATTFGAGTTWVSGSIVADSVCVGFENGTYAGVGSASAIELIAGGADSNLTLAPLDVCVFTITYEINAGISPAVSPDVETYTNTAAGTSTDPYGNTVGDSGQTTSDVSYTNGLELTKSAVQSQVNPDGTLDVAYDIAMHNPGIVNLANVQIADDLRATFGIDDVADIVSGPTLVTDPTGCFLLDATYDGVTNVAMLDAGNTLDAGETCTVTLSASLTIGQLNPVPPASGDQTYTNTADGAGDDPYGQNLAASDTAEITIVDGEFTLAMSTVKTLEPGYPVLLPNGSMDLLYSITVANTGTLDIANLTVIDDLIPVYGTGSIITAQTVTATAPCTANGAWDGDPASDINLLVGTDTLRAAEDPDDPDTPIECTITVAFNVMPPAPPAELPAETTYTNTASAAGHAPGIATLTVAAADTADSIIGYNPEIGLAKALSAGPTFNIDGTVGIEYTMVVLNSGDIDLADVQVADDLLATFGAASIFANLTVDADDVGPCQGFENPLYDAGVSDSNLFDPTIVPGLALAVGESCTVTVSFDVIPGDTVPGDNFGTTYNNTASASGNDPYGVGISDDSTDGSDPDPGADGPGDDSVPTPVSFAPTAELSTTKAIADGPVLNADGSMSLTYSITVANTGDVIVADVAVPDDLEAVFGSASTISVDALTASAPLVANAGYDGLAASDINLVDGLVALEPGQSSTIELAITVFSTIPLPGPFENSVTANGVDPWGAGVEDTSNDGVDADPDDDGDPSNNSTPTAFELPFVSELGVAKAITDGPINNGDGSYTLTYQFVTTNLGTVTVSNLQLNDDVESTYGAGSTLVVDSLSADSTYAVNSAFDGLSSGDTGLLAGTDSLAPGDTVTIDLTITVTPTIALPGPYDNVATASGTDPYGTPVSDDSISGSNPDPDGDGSGAETGPTTVGFGQNPIIGLAKEISSGPTLNEDGSFTLTYSFVAANLGDVNIANVQIDDDLNATFGVGVQVTVDTLEASLPLTPSASYDGLTDIGLLAGSDTLAVGETSTIDLTITVIPEQLGQFENNATISGTDPTGAAVEDDSVNGSDPDPEGTGDAAAESPTPLALAVEPMIAVAKQVVGTPTANSDGSFRTTFELIVANTGPIELRNVNVTDDLQAQWVGADFNVVSVSSSVLTTNAAFNGMADINLLAATDTMAVDAQAAITLVVDIKRPASGDDLENEANATGASPYGTVNALSVNGGDPTGEPSATPLTLPAPALLPFGLPRTGGEAWRMGGLGLILVSTGCGMWLLSGRRRDDEAQA